MNQPIYDPLLLPSPQHNGRPAPIQVGQLTLQPEHFIAEGGFARVYLARTFGHKVVALKVINSSPDPRSWQPVQQELELMKRLQHPKIVRYLDSSTYQRPDGSFLFHLVMEYCTGGGLLDMMNRMKQLGEAQVWQIFTDVVDAVAYMHSQGVVHRDLKVENVLLSVGDTGALTYKLCDFGSCTTQQYAAGHQLSSQEISLLQEEFDKVTTLSYRAPEMCDLYKIRRVGLTAKTDIWALGVLLYKLCYYCVPFSESDGKLAILNNRYTIPNQPQYSGNIIQLIKQCLSESAIKRPNAYQVMLTCCQVQGIECKITEFNSPYDAAPVEKDLPLPPQQQEPAPQLLAQPAVSSNVRRGRVHQQTPSTGSAVNESLFFNTVPATIQHDQSFGTEQLNRNSTTQNFSQQSSTSTFIQVFNQGNNETVQGTQHNSFFQQQSFASNGTQQAHMDNNIPQQAQALTQTDFFQSAPQAFYTVTEPDQDFQPGFQAQQSFDSGAADASIQSFTQTSNSGTPKREQFAIEAPPPLVATTQQNVSMSINQPSQLLNNDLVGLSADMFILEQPKSAPTSNNGIKQQSMGVMANKSYQYQQSVTRPPQFGTQPAQYGKYAVMSKYSREQAVHSQKSVFDAGHSRGKSDPGNQALFSDLALFKK